jgi:hypothetical protein
METVPPHHRWKPYAWQPWRDCSQLLTIRRDGELIVDANLLGLYR